MAFGCRDGPCNTLLNLWYALFYQEIAIVWRSQKYQGHY